MNCLSAIFNGLLVSGIPFEAESLDGFTRIDIWEPSPLIRALVEDAADFYSMTYSRGPYYDLYQDEKRGIEINIYDELEKGDTYDNHNG